MPRPHDADDLVHECLLRALEAGALGARVANLRPWLFAIMRNVFISGQRRAMLWRQRESAVTASVPAPADHVPQHFVVEIGELMRAVQKLPVEQRDVLLLVVRDDLTYADVAERLGVPLGTVMSRLARARATLARSAGVPKD